ncbi:MAG: hypothetical protein JWO44_448 [Bacteroidetes bacterium]|nr:hypothetical protein [Bacteroidota bacterium]
MENTTNTPPEHKGGGIGPVVIISAALIGIIIVLKYVMG